MWRALYHVERNPVRAQMVRVAWRYLWSSAAVLRIPVVVHVLHNTDEENLSLSQIEALNRDFRLRNGDQADVPVDPDGA